MMSTKMEELGYETPTLAELCALVSDPKNNVTDEKDPRWPIVEQLAKDLWWATIGQFESENIGWELKMESDWMTKNNLVYQDLFGQTGRMAKGCIARMFTICRVEKLKQVNRHGDKVGIT